MFWSVSLFLKRIMASLNCILVKVVMVKFHHAEWPNGLFSTSMWMCQLSIFRNGQSTFNKCSHEISPNGIDIENTSWRVIWILYHADTFLIYFCRNVIYIGGCMIGFPRCFNYGAIINCLTNFSAFRLLCQGSQKHSVIRNTSLAWAFLTRNE